MAGRRFVLSAGFLPFSYCREKLLGLDVFRVRVLRAWCYLRRAQLAPPWWFKGLTLASEGSGINSSPGVSFVLQVRRDEPPPIGRDQHCYSLEDEAALGARKVCPPV